MAAIDGGGKGDGEEGKSGPTEGLFFSAVGKAATCTWVLYTSTFSLRHPWFWLKFSGLLHCSVEKMKQAGMVVPTNTTPPPPPPWHHHCKGIRKAEREKKKK